MALDAVSYVSDLPFAEQAQVDVGIASIICQGLGELGGEVSVLQLVDHLASKGSFVCTYQGREFEVCFKNDSGIPHVAVLDIETRASWSVTVSNLLSSRFEGLNQVLRLSADEPQSIRYRVHGRLRDAIGLTFAVAVRAALKFVPKHSNLQKLDAEFGRRVFDPDRRPSKIVKLA